MKIKSALSIGILGACAITAAAQQTPNPQPAAAAGAQQAAAARGSISGNVAELSSGRVVKKATVRISRQNSPDAAPQPQPQNQPLTVEAGAVGTTAARGTALGGTVGTTAGGGGRGGRGGGGNPPNQPNNGGQNPGGRGGRGGFPGGGFTATVQTANDGTYIFNEVPAGDYTVAVTAEQYLNQEYGQRTWSGRGTPLTLAAGERRGAVDFKLVKGGVISGTIVDEDGIPMANVPVRAMTYDYANNGQRNLANSGEQRTTDDIGRYRLYYLTPGDYYVMASPTGTEFNNFDFGNFQNRGGGGPGGGGPGGGGPGGGGFGGPGGGGPGGGGPGGGGFGGPGGGGPGGGGPGGGGGGGRGAGGGGGGAGGGTGGGGGGRGGGGGGGRGNNFVAEQAGGNSLVAAQGRGGGGGGRGGQGGGGGRGGQGGGNPGGGQGGQQGGQQGGNPQGGRGFQVNNANPNEPQEGYAPAFYPGTVDVSQAAAVQLPPGGNVPGIDFTLRPIRMVTVAGVVLQPSTPIVPKEQPQQQNPQQQRGNNPQQQQQQQQGRGGQAQQAQQGQRGGGTNPPNAQRGGQNPQQQQQQPQQGRGTPQQQQQQQQQTGRGNPQDQGRGGNPGNPDGGNSRPQVILIAVGRGGGGGGGGRGGRGGGGAGLGGAKRANVNDDGTFTVTGVVPGVYNVVAYATTNNVQLTATQKVDLTGGGLPGLSLPLRQGLSIRGQIYVDGAPPADFRLNQAQIQLQTADDLPQPRNARAQWGADGAFTLEDVIPGARYRVTTNFPSGGYVMVGRYGEANALAGPITIDTEETVLQLQIGFTPGRIESLVVDAGKPQSGIRTVLVPNDRGRFDLYRPLNSNAQGKVTFDNVPPGDYKLFAWEEVRDRAWQDPIFMEKFEDKGRPVRVDKKGASTEEVQIIKAEGYIN